MIDFSSFDSLFALVTYFDSSKHCKTALAQARWADCDVVCPYCGKHHCYTCKDGRYKCPECRRMFNVTVGTIFENTKISLVKWFMAMYLISSHKKGISSHQLGRDLKELNKTIGKQVLVVDGLEAETKLYMYMGALSFETKGVAGKSYAAYTLKMKQVEEDFENFNPEE